VETTGRIGFGVVPSGSFVDAVNEVAGPRASRVGCARAIGFAGGVCSVKQLGGTPLACTGADDGA